jgi:hypothetical protein
VVHGAGSWCGCVVCSAWCVCEHTVVVCSCVVHASARVHAWIVNSFESEIFFHRSSSLRVVALKFLKSLIYSSMYFTNLFNLP